MVRITPLMTALLVSSVSWTTVSAQEEEWKRCVPKTERAPDVKFIVRDQTDHPGGGYHEGRIFFFPQCQYFPDCTTQCLIEAAPWVDENNLDLGLWDHVFATEKENGSGTGSKGASVSCSSAAVAAVDSCFLGVCNIDIEWAWKNSPGITFQSEHLWRYGQIHTHTCAPPTRATGPGRGDRRGPNPNRCQPCGSTRVCGDWYEVCPGWEEGKSDDDCRDWQRDCFDVDRWCCPFGASPGATSEEEEPLCGDWMEAAVCEPGSTCCLDSQQFPSGPTCASAGLFSELEEAQCAEACGGAPCEPASVVKGDCESGPCDVTRCWQCSAPGPTCTVPAFSASTNSATVGETVSFIADASTIREDPAPLWDLGNGVSLTGNPVSYAYPEPGNYSVRFTAPDATCGSLQVSTPQTIAITAGAPSCGALGGDYCSQSGSCPGGYSSLGASSDCSPCCKAEPLPSCGALGGNYCSPTGSCPAGYASLGASSDCSACCTYEAPSCGEMGGDYCGQSGSCPTDYTSLGASWDCNPCCKYEPPPSCGALGGDYCSQSESCPEGYSSLGASADCVQCCRS